MRTEYKVGENFLTRYELDIKELENGEYEVPFEMARGLKCYSFSNTLKMDEIKQLITDCKEKGDSEFYTTDNVLAVLEFGNFDVELTYYDIDEEYGLDIGFFCCKNSEKYGWESEGFTDLEVTLDLFDSEEKLERVMYETMIDYMKKHEFTWSKKNK